MEEKNQSITPNIHCIGHISFMHEVVWNIDIQIFLKPVRSVLGQKKIQKS